MKKILLSTALSMVLVSPAFAEEEPPVKVLKVISAEEHAEAVAADMEAAKAVAEKAANEAVEATVNEVAEQGVVIESSQETPKAAPKGEFLQDGPTGDMTAVDAPSAPPEIEMSMSEDADAVPQEDKAQDNIAHDVAEEAPASGDHEGAHASWGYSGAGAAPYWGNLSAEYAACKDGQKQSPINIAKFLQEDVPNIESAYNPSPLSIVNNGHTVQVNYAPGSGFSVDDMRYELLQIHFHTPSEHYLDGAPYPMEAHFVHKAADGTLGVVGVMMKVGEHNHTIEAIWLNTPINAGGTKEVESVEINAADLMPASLDYYKYDGSLTTPPCSEGVRWHVMKDTIELSETQLKAFQALFPVNARPVQPLNDRVVTGD